MTSAVDGTGPSTNLPIHLGPASGSFRNTIGPASLFLQFDGFFVDMARRELRGAGGVIHVEPQVFDLLLYFTSISPEMPTGSLARTS